MDDTKPLYLVAIDGSEPSDRALDTAIALAGQTGASVLIAHVIPWSGYVPMGVQEAYARPAEKIAEEEKAYDEVVQPALTQARVAGVTFQEFHSWGTPAKVLRELVDDRAVSLLVMGRKGRSSLTDVMIGSVANGLAHSAPCPVLLVP